VKAIYGQAKLYGYAWVTTDKTGTASRSTRFCIHGDLRRHLDCAPRPSWPGGWPTPSAAPWQPSIVEPGADALSGSGSSLPAAHTVENEIGDLIEAFNRMVASIEEQRAGLSDTLSLLDSMLANAPIGWRSSTASCRFVRVNRIFAGFTVIPLSRHLGRTLPEVLPAIVAHQLEKTIHVSLRTT
jgi:HAMP domain-containing protein